MRVSAGLRLHADNKIKKIFPFNNFVYPPPPYRGRDHSFHIRNVYPITCNLVAIDIDQEAGLAKFSHNREVSEAGHIGEDVFDLYRFVLKHVQVVTVYFDRQRTLKAGQCFIHSILGRLSVVEDDSREGGEFLIDRFDELLFIAGLAGPRFVLVWLQADVELAVKKTGGISTI